MRSRSVAGIAVGALTLGVAGPPAAAAAQGSADDPRFCSTVALSRAELEAGVMSVISCFDSAAGALSAGHDELSGAAGSMVLAYHHDGTGALGDSFYVLGTGCDGGGLNIAAGDPWVNRISSTRHQACSKVKHWTGTGYAGTSQTTEGEWGAIRNLNGTLGNSVRSIQYFGPVN